MEPEEIVEEQELVLANEPAPEEPEPESEPESKPRRGRRPAVPEMIYVYSEKDGGGYRFAGIGANGKWIESTISEKTFPNVQSAKRAAHAEFPEVRIRT